MLFSIQNLEREHWPIIYFGGDVAGHKDLWSGSFLAGLLADSKNDLLSELCSVGVEQ